MAFKRVKKPRRGLMLFGLIDVIFILLFFFIVTLSIGASKREQSVKIALPKNGEAPANVLIQIIDDDHFLWVDCKEFDNSNPGQVYPSIQRNVINIINNLPRIDKTMLLDKIKHYLQNISILDNNKIIKSYILIRCPDNINYGVVIDILRQINLYKNPYVQYGLIGGTYNDIENARITVRIQPREYIIRYR